MNSNINRRITGKKLRKSQEIIDSLGYLIIDVKRCKILINVRRIFKLGEIAESVLHLFFIEPPIPELSSPHSREYP